MKQPMSLPPIDDPQPPGWHLLLGVVVAFPLAVGVFFVLWAGLNTGWDAVRDRLIVPAVFEAPCQQVAGTTERLTGYSQLKRGRRGGLLQAPRCHFGERSNGMAETVWDRAFAARDFWLFLVVDGIVLFANIFGAIIGTVWLSILARRLIDRLSGPTRQYINRQRPEAAAPAPDTIPRRQRRRGGG